MSILKRGVEFLLVVLALAAIAFGATAAEVARDGADVVIPAHRQVGDGGGIAVAPVRPSTPAAPAVPAVQPKRSAEAYGPNAIEYYLANEVLYYVRPGLKIKVNSITIPADRRPLVDLTITDDLDQPLDRNGKVTPGAVSISLILAWWDAGTRHYTSYTTRTQTSPITGVSAVQAGTDSGGTFTDIEVGHSTYKFKTVLPAGFDQTKTTTLGIYSTRNTTDILGKNYYANVEYDFRPDGAAVTEVWDKIRDQYSCNNCHDPLSAHGGSRRDVKLCVLCHQPQTVDPDTGQTVDMKVMVHKIHFGPNLPSVKAGTPYVIIGNQQSVHDYSHVTLPQDIRNCENCHEGRNTTADQKPKQYNVYYTYPSAAACGSCHDDLNFTTGANHPAGPATDDTCASCHIPQGDVEFDASIKGAHTIPAESKQLKGLKAEIVSVDQVGAGKKPVVTFKITNGDGSIVDGTKLTSFAPILAGPTADYRTYYREANAQQRVTFNGTTNVYTFQNAIPAEATGTWVVSADIYRNATIKRGDGGADITQREPASNPIKYIAVTGNLTPRRKDFDIASCNTCHDRLRLHGEQRNVGEECVICHNPTEGDQSRRPASAGKPESIDFRRMIHRIHTGEELTQDFTIYGFGGSVNNFNEVLYPGDRRNCVKCHAGTTYQLPTGGVDSVKTERDYFTPQGPGTAACLGCHDNKDAAAHAYLNTAPFGEACATCHGTGADWAAEKVHAR